jgi:hypothetical protein
MQDPLLVDIAEARKAFVRITAGWFAFSALFYYFLDQAARYARNTNQDGSDPETARMFAIGGLFLAIVHLGLWGRSERQLYRSYLQASILSAGTALIAAVTAFLIGSALTKLALLLITVASITLFRFAWRVARGTRQLEMESRSNETTPNS